MAVFRNEFNGPNYGGITQGGRDVVVTTVTVSPLDALRAAAQLRAALGRVPLPAQYSGAAERDLESVERELRSGEPNRQEIARRLKRFTETLKAAGALASAGAAFVEPIGAIARSLGPLGSAVVDALRR